MSWLFQSQQANAIIALLDNPDISLHQILEDQNLLQALRMANPKLVNFFLREDNVSELLDWTLTKSHSNENNAVKITRSAVNVLTTQSKQLQTGIAGSPIFRERINAFPNSECHNDSKICGYFQRIIENIVRFTSGKFLSEIPTIFDFLIANIDVLGLRELFVILFSDYIHTLDNPNSIVKSLLYSEKIEENGYFIFFTISSIFKQNIELASYFAPLFDRILSLATSQSSIAAIECFRVASQIIEWVVKNPSKSTIQKISLDSIISQLSVSYKLSERKIDCVTAFAARVFTKEAAKLIKVIFDSPANTFLNESIIFAFEKLEKNEKLQIVQKENLLTLIIHSFKKSKANGYIAKLAEVLNTELASELQSNAEWSEFTEKVLTPHIEQRNHVEIVKNSSSDDDESDDHDYYGSGIGDNIIDFSDSDSSDDDDDEDSDDSDEDSDEEEEKDEDDTNNGQNGSLLLSASDEEDFNTDSTEVKTGITKSNVTSYTENDDSSTDKLNSTLEMEKEFVMTDSEPEEANPNTQNASTNQENDDTPQKVDEKQESQQVESEEK